MRNIGKAGEQPNPFLIVHIYCSSYQRRLPFKLSLLIHPHLSLRALSGGLGRSLRVLRLSDNGLSSLPVSLFGGEGGPPPPPPPSSEEEDGGLSLRELYLSNNSLAGLPSALLGRLGHRLLVLNLSGNAVSNAWVNTRHSPFAALTHLAALDLSGNRMAFLPERALVSLTSKLYERSSFEVFLPLYNLAGVYVKRNHHHQLCCKKTFFQKGFLTLFILSKDNIFLKKVITHFAFTQINPPLFFPRMASPPCRP